MKIKPSILIAGFLGGAATPLLVMAVKVTGVGPGGEISEGMNLSAGFLMGVLVLGIVGSIVVWCSDETVKKKAFALGLSLPGLVTSIISQQEMGGEGIFQHQQFQAPTSEGVSENPPDEGSGSGVSLTNIGSLGLSREAASTTAIRTARSAETSTTAETGKSTLLRLKSKTPLNLKATVLDADGKPLQSFDVTNSEHSLGESARYIRLEGAGQQTKVIPVEKGKEDAGIDLTVESRRNIGFWQALGFPVEKDLKVSNGSAD